MNTDFLNRKHFVKVVSHKKMFFIADTYLFPTEKGDHIGYCDYRARHSGSDYWVVGGIEEMRRVRIRVV